MREKLLSAVQNGTEEELNEALKNFKFYRVPDQGEVQKANQRLEYFETKRGTLERHEYRFFTGNLKYRKLQVKSSNLKMIQNNNTIIHSYGHNLQNWALLCSEEIYECWKLQYTMQKIYRT